MSKFGGREVVIVEAVRTPVGRGHKEKGYYKDTHPADLLGKTFTEVVARSGIDPSEVEIVLSGCVQQFGLSPSSCTPLDTRPPLRAAIRREPGLLHTRLGRQQMAATTSAKAAV